MIDREGPYLRFPLILQNASCSFEGWRLRRFRHGDAFSGMLQQAEARSFWPVEQTQIFRDQRVQSLVRHCAESVPFYRRQFQELGVSAEDIRTLEDLRCLPILTKQEVQSIGPDLVSQSIPPRQHIAVHTSGTTGSGLRFVTTRHAVQEQWATWWRYRRWHGLEFDTWCGYFGGRSLVPAGQASPPFWRYNYPGRQILFSGYHMSPDNMGAYVAELQRRRPPWLHGYPSLLALLAGFLLEADLSLGYVPQWITTGAETLLSQQAALMKRAFGVPPRQHYGMAEAVANFSECEMGALHVDEDFAGVEFVANPDGPGYKVIGTNFTNPATPLLRYDAGDVVTLSDQACPCGRPGRVVKQIDGRLEDYVVLKNGARLGRLDHIFKDMVNVREAQVCQERPGEILIRVVRSHNYSETDERALLQATRRRVGDSANVRIEYTDELPRSATGKLRFVVSELLDSKIGAPGGGSRPQE